jgi:hypothetical protein
MTNGGLYIPMPEHINTLCATPRFGQCHHYRQGCAAIREVAGQLGYAHDASRRRYPRVQERIPIQIADYGHDGRAAEILDSNAFTVDLSLGGIRVESQVPLPTRKRVAFVVGKEGSGPCWDGLGEVRWTENIRAGAFQSGLIVTDQKTFQAIGHHLTLPGVSSL